jgi:peptidoglycan/xylan/chitin deacetylase (PgdA/CDA1 family)
MNRKFIALSFDDGTTNDERLVRLLNKYSIKASFHLNAGLIPMDDEISDLNRLPLTRIKHLYTGHEVAAHSYSHPDLCELNEEEIFEEVNSDIRTLNVYFNQNTLGFAYPFGTFDECIINQLKLTSLYYARTIRDTLSFQLPSDPFLLDPTCHIMYPGLFDLTQNFIDDNSNKPLFFLVWGHSYELEKQEDWDRFESFLRIIAEDGDIFSGSIIECLTQMEMRKII